MKIHTLNTLIIEPNQPFYSSLKNTLELTYTGEVYRAINNFEAIDRIKKTDINLILYNNRFVDTYKPNLSKMNKNINTLNVSFLNCIYYQTLDLITYENEFIDMLSNLYLNYNLADRSYIISYTINNDILQLNYSIYCINPPEVGDMKIYQQHSLSLISLSFGTLIQ